MRAARAVHRLQKKMLEAQFFKALRFATLLRKHQFQFIAARKRKRRARLGADAHPVDARRRLQGAIGFNGDGALATSALIAIPTGIGVDSKNLYIGDWGNSVIRQVDLSTNMISTFAGVPGIPVSFGDNGPLSRVAFRGPDSLSVDADGNMLIGDDNRFRVIAAGMDLITGLAGSRSLGFAGDGATGSLSSARFALPRTGVITGRATYLIADTGNYRIRRIQGTELATVAGSGSIDGQSALSTNFNLPASVARDAAGNLIVSDLAAHRLRRIAAGTSVVSTIAGTGTAGSLEGRINSPTGIAIGSNNTIYFADSDNNRIIRLNADGSRVFAGASNGAPGFTGDGQVATSARLRSPRGLAIDANDNLYIADYDNGRVRKVTAEGAISTVAGSGPFGFSGDGGPATSAGISPIDVAVDASGNLYIADDLNGRIRRVAASNGVISTVAGTGRFTGASGDGGPATGAELIYPQGIAVDASGNLFIADTLGARIRRVDGRTGIVTSIAGSGSAFHNQESGAALGTNMSPLDVAIDTGGALLVVDAFNDRIRRLTPLTPRNLILQSGNNASGQPGSRLQVAVGVSDAAGAPLAGVLVNFLVTSGSARLQASALQTGLDGLAFAEVILGETLGPVAVRAESMGLTPVTINLAVAAPQVTVLNPAIDAGGVVGLPQSVQAPVRALATGSLVAISGVDLAPNAAKVVATADLAGGKLPTVFNGACVDVGGVRAPLLAVGPKQIVIQVPAVADPGPSAVRVTALCGTEREFTSQTLDVPVRGFSPEFFYARKNGEGPVAVLSLASGAAAASVKPGDDVIVYLTGLGATQPAFEPGVLVADNAIVAEPVTLKLGELTLGPDALIYVGTTAEFPGEAFVGGISQNAGIYQIRFVVPETAPDGELPIFAVVGGVTSPVGAVLKVERVAPAGIPLMREKGEGKSRGKLE